MNQDRISYCLAFREDERGVGMVEFAILLPLLLFVIVGVADLGRGFSEVLKLEQAANRSLEKVAVGSVQTDYNYLKPEAASAAGVAESNVVVDAWLECDGAKQSSFEGECQENQMVTRYVEITVNSKFRPSFNYNAFGRIFATGADGTMPIKAKTALRVQ